MAAKVTVKGTVTEAKYFREEKSIVVIVKEDNDGKISKPIQISSSSFKFRPDQDVDDEMKKTADLMVGKRLNIEFEGKESPAHG